MFNKLISLNLLTMGLLMTSALAAAVPLHTKSHHSTNGALERRREMQPKAREFIQWLSTNAEAIKKPICFYSGKTTIKGEVKYVYQVWDSFLVQHNCNSLPDLLKMKGLTPADWRDPAAAWDHVHEWNPISKALADRAEGAANVVLGEQEDQTAVWFTTERRAVMENPKVTKLVTYRLKGTGEIVHEKDEVTRGRSPSRGNSKSGASRSGSRRSTSPGKDELYRTNDEPDEVQLDRLTAIVSRNKDQILSVIPFVGYGTTSYDYTAAITGLQQYTRHKPLLSPIRRIPNEILAKVFQELIIHRHDELEADALAVAQVCRRWRDLIRPLLPSAGTFVVPRGTNNSSSRMKQALIEFNAYTPQEAPPKFTDGRYLWAMSSLFSLSLSIDPSTFTTLTGLLINRLHELRRLRLEVVGQPNKYAGYLYVFESAKCLRYVELRTKMKILIKFPVGQLVECKEVSHDEGKILQRGARMLRKLDLTIHTPAFTPFTLDQGFDTPRILESLDVKMYDIVTSGSDLSKHVRSSGTSIRKAAEDCIDFYEAADDLSITIRSNLPRLRQLRIRDPYRNVYTGIQQLITISAPNTPGTSSTLTRLALCGTRPNPSEVCRLLSLTPNLLYLECGDIPNIDLFLLNEDKPLPVPKLEEIVIHDAALENLFGLDKFVASRMKLSRRTLRSVRLLYSNPQHRERAESRLSISTPDHDPTLETIIERLENQIYAAKGNTNRGDGIVSNVRRLIAPSSNRDDDSSDHHAFNTLLTSLDSLKLENPFVIKVRSAPVPFPNNEPHKLTHISFL
ncbi:hypothetical protein CVT24_011368 [Panaeolus cyanescens]|uniref:F-box domain-containing protein n=1 Tax=Panaeolus cyanescens TaxID=181874 RepID=A0A409YGP4_9AGAR|nr:hypothetical protein CVT24_011368 [Panaeolus cyanescens]